MRIKAIFATLVGAVALQSGSAGEWCPPVVDDKCPIEDCCADLPGSVSMGYDTDYLFYGIRVARDNVWGEVSYTIDSLPLPLTLSVWHLSSLGSGIAGVSDAYGDETDVTASFALPSIFGIDSNIGYRSMNYATTRAPSGTATVGDMQNEIFMDLSTEIACGVTLGYRAAYDFNIRDFDATPAGQDLSGSWMHIANVSKSFDITDCLGLDLTAGVFYSDNYWQSPTYSRAGGGRARDTGWQNYYIQASLPIAVGRCATLTPYIGYNGTPDGWVGDGLQGMGAANNNTGANANDLIHGGVSISVGF